MTTSRLSADSHSLSYRSDIDGLRAIAVLAVIAFHLWGSSFAGGYLGVDIFFVLSGFLITSIILREIQQDKFTIVRFYERRIRRIMPALLLVLFVTTAAATFILLPTDLVSYAKSLLATLGFVANVYFWRDTDYFSAIADTKPLLHIWSLGVEEQFYIAFPLILGITARRWRNGVIPVVISITAASFILAVLANRMNAGIPAFFLLPTRAWELGAGALVAILPGRKTPGRAWAETVTGLIGVSLVAAGLVFPQALPNPMPDAFLVVAGTSFLLAKQPGSLTAVTRALSWRPLAFVGLISYSLYLCHWPILVMLRYYRVRPLGATDVMASLAAMFLCAVASWWFVERPFRQKALSTKRVLFVVGAAAVLLASSALALIASRGLPGRLNAEAATINEAVATNYRCPVSDYLVFGASRACLLALPSRDPADADVVLLGNSHAQMYAPAWKRVLEKRGLHGLLVPLGGCLPTTTINIHVECNAAAEENLAEVLRLHRARIVIIGLTWIHDDEPLFDEKGRLVDNRLDRALVAAIDALIDRLRRGGKQVILIGPIAKPGWDVASETGRNLRFGHLPSHVLFAARGPFDAYFKEALAHFEARRDVVLALPEERLCDAKKCPFIVEGRSLYADTNHLAAAELWRVDLVFDQALKRLEARGN